MLALTGITPPTSIKAVRNPMAEEAVWGKSGSPPEERKRRNEWGLLPLCLPTGQSKFPDAPQKETHIFPDASNIELSGI